MRLLLSLLLLLTTASAASAGPPTASAALFAERTALLAGDARCKLLSAGARNALVATTGQVRADALRDGWTAATIDDVARRAAAAGRGRDCRDAQLLAAAQSASTGFKAWASIQKQQFAGEYRVWTARRTPDPDGFTLLQTLPGGLQFGILQRDGVETLTFAAPAAAASVMPASARLLLRDRARAKQPLFDIPGRARAPGIAGAAPPISIATARFASARALDQRKDAPARMLFTFPSTVLAEIATLDPREAIMLELTPTDGRATYAYIEVGDLAVACAFLASRPAA